MEVPFYYEFKEFEKEYIFNFERFRDTFFDLEDYLRHQYERVDKEYERISNENYILTDKEKQQFGKMEGFVEVATQKMVSDILDYCPEYFPDYKKGESKQDYLLKVRLGLIKLSSEEKHVEEKEEERRTLNDKVFNAFLKEVICLNLDEIVNFILSKLLEIKNLKELSTNTKQQTKRKLSNPKKLALLSELGIFDLPTMKNLSDDSQNEIIGLLLDADKTEFVYKNRLNINSKDPSYQIDKYGAYKYLDEMKRLISDDQ